MRLTMKERQRLTAVVARRFQSAGKKQKGVILNEFVESTGYRRSYGAYLLRTHGKRVRIDKEFTIVGDVRKKAGQQGHKRYTKKVAIALRKIWLILDCICGKRLVSILPEIIPILERCGEISLSREVREKLMVISAATIDRLLADDKQKLGGRGRSGTKPGSLLKSQIPIRTFSEWVENKPGFVEIDLVGHDGGNSRGEYIQTLDVTDVMTSWTETRAVRNKAQIRVHEAIVEIRKRLPFELLGIDSDNGSEFINNQLVRYCEQNRITFTRTRSYRKNDNCFVEQKNYSVVRRAVGYLRYDTEEELELLNKLYDVLRLYTNYFQPTMKLKQRERAGSKVTKKYDQAATPYKRVLASAEIPAAQERRLRQEYESLNPAELKRKITAFQNRLLDLAKRKPAAFSSRGDHRLRSSEVKLSVTGS